MKINPMSIFYTVSVVLAALLAGLIVHELFHILTMANAHSITLYFGNIAGKLFGVCCLTGTESPNEGMAYLIQTIVTMIYLIIGFNVVQEKFRK